MKPLPAAPLTFEDWEIFMDHRNDPRRAYLLGIRFGINRHVDRRDAELMLRCQQFRTQGFTGTLEATPLYPLPEALRMDGDPRPVAVFGGDITNCA